MKISICISSYNGDKYIEETINSILNQSYKDLEIIIIDDSSKDNTLEKIKSFKDSRIKYLQNKYNLGLTKNINKMVSNAKGRFCILLGQDDVLMPDHIEKIIKKFETKETVLIHCNAKYIDKDGKNLKINARDNNIQIYKNKNPIKYLAYENYIQSVGMIFRRDAFLACGGWDERYPLCGEWLFNIKMSKLGKFGYCESLFPSYRKHAGSTMKKLNNQKIFHLFLYQTHCRFYAFKISRLNFRSKLRFFTKFIFSIFSNLVKFIK